MSATIYLPDKDALEIIPLTWTATNTALLISAVSITVTVSAGIDSNPSAILFGSATGTGTQTILQLIQNGVVGCTYKIKAVLTLADGTKPVITSLLSVVG